MKFLEKQEMERSQQLQYLHNELILNHTALQNRHAELMKAQSDLMEAIKKMVSQGHGLENPSARLADVPETSCGLFYFFQHHTEGAGIHKWVHYFPIYEEHFGRFCRADVDVRMAEIGVQSGGSMLMWRHAFGQKLKLMLGMDINNATRRFEALGDNVKIEIGDQGNSGFLQQVREKYPEGFDILLDDGSHLPEHQFTTFVHLWEAIRPGGVFMIEDVHGRNPLLNWLLSGHTGTGAAHQGLYYPNGQVGPSDGWEQIGGDFLNNYIGLRVNPASKVQNEIESIKIYPYVLAITKRQSPVRIAPEKHGSGWIPYHR